MEIGFKSFISEDQIEQKKKIKQQLWEQNRSEDQPLGNYIKIDFYLISL